MRRVVLSSLGYFAIVFAAGFGFGAVRVLWLEPQVGKTYAVACEAPLMAIVIFLAARSLPARLGLEMRVWPLCLMGLGALALQQMADFVLGIFLRGMPAAEQLAYLATPAGLIYMGLLALFAGMPLLANFSRLGT